MEATATSPAGQTRQARWRELGHDLGLLLLLLALAAGLRVWTLTHTEVTARDSIGFIRYALQLEEKPLVEVLRGNHQHPGYATLVLLVSWPVRHWTGVTDSQTMQLSAQLASSLASVLLVVPLFWLGKFLFNRRIAFWATVIFQCLPVSGRVLGDALSEALFLFWMASALLAAVHAVRTRSWWLSGLCGLLGGLAYLTRPEGAFVLLATGLVLLGLQLSRSERRPWRSVLACGGALALGSVLVGGPYVMVLGQLSPKPTARFIITGERSDALQSQARQPVQLALAGPLLPGLPLFADRLKGLSFDGAVQAVAKETQKGFNYVGWVPALLGLWWFRDRLRTTPGTWVLLLLCLVHLLVLYRLVMSVRYISERHVLVLVLCGVFWTAAGLDELPRRLAALRERFPGVLRWAPTLLLVLFIAAGLPKTLKPLHANRAGHHAAGLWLAEHADPSDQVIDPFCWAHFYSGGIFREEKPLAPPPPGHQPKTYVVLEDDDLEVRQPWVTHARALAARGQRVYHWPAHKPGDKADVQVFAVPRAMP